MTLQTYLAIGGLLAAFTAGYALSHVMHKNEVTALLKEAAEHKAASNQMIAEAHAKARQAERDSIIKLNDAARKRQEDIHHAEAAATNARSELDRLRKQLAAALSPASGGSTTTAPADGISALAVADVLGECGAELTDLARKADGHVADVRMMQAAWF